MLTTDVFDGRALWLQPAGLVARGESSVSMMATVDHASGQSLSLGQYGITLASGPLGLGWQHDRAGTSGHTDAFVIGYAVGRPDVSIGVDHRWHRGTSTHSSAWDVGARFTPSSYLALSLVWRDVGSPVILDTNVLRSTLVPGVAVSLFKHYLQVGADWEIVTRDWGTSAVRAGATLKLPKGISAGLRGEFTGRLRGRSLALTVSWSRPKARFSGFRTGDRESDVDHYGVWASAIATEQARHRGPFR